MRIKIILLACFLALNLRVIAGENSVQNQDVLTACVEQEYLDQELISDLFGCIERGVPLTYNPRIYGFIDYFVNRDRAYTQRVIHRSYAYFPIFEEEFSKRGLPDELKYLSIVESGLNPKAISRAGAGGLWQFMPSTGKMYGLKVDYLIDDRLDPYLSTVAAAKYLESLYRQFGDWELALAAYNCGPGKVRRAIRRSGYKKSFWEVYPWLPRETRNYVPQFLAFVYIMNYRAELGFYDESGEYLPEFKTITVNQNLDVETFSESLNTCYEDIALLNPQIKRGLIPIQRKDLQVRIPIECYDLYEENKEVILARSSELDEQKKHIVATYDRTSTYGKEKHVYKVKSGDVLGRIAERYHVRVSDIRKWNNIRGSMIRVGQRLAIWKAPGYNATASNTQVRQAPKPVPGSKVHVVKYGDTLWDISKMYQGLSIEKIKSLNNLKTSRIKPGQVLRIG